MNITLILIISHIMIQRLDRFHDDGRKRLGIYLVTARSFPALEVLCIELSRKRSSSAGSEKMERVGEG
jgi:hypothetical protein